MSTARGDVLAGPEVDSGDPIRARYLREGYWSEEETLQLRIAATAREFPSRLAAVDAARRQLTYAELERRADALARGLRAVGVGRGDVVGMQLPNRVEAVVAMCGLERLGAVIVPLMPMYRVKELTHIARTAAMRTVVVQASYRDFDYAAQARELIEAGWLERAVLVDGEAEEGAASSMHGFEELTEAGAGEEGPLPSPAPDDAAAVMFTSGTTGSPKGVLHNHNTLLSGNRIFAGVLGLDERDAIFVPSVVGHATGYVWGMRLALYLRTRAVLLDRWEPLVATTLLAEQRCTWMMVAPTFVQDLLEASRENRIDLSSLRYISCGGAAPATELYGRARQELGCELLRLYGQTEAFLSTHCLPGDPEEKLTSTEGRALPGADLRVVLEDGREAPAGELGELQARGPHRSIGLLDAAGLHPLGTAAWMPSGDLASIDAEGYLSIRGRRKEFINRGGFKYSPVEVEDLLHRHRKIARAAIVAVPDARLGERGCACVVAREGAEPTLEELVEYLRENGMAPFKWPERLVVLDALPTTASGKVQKHVLQELIAAPE